MLKMRLMIPLAEQRAIARRLDALVVEIDRCITLGAEARATLAGIRAMLLGDATAPPRRRPTRRAGR